jgi:hypothetical protein
MFNDRQAFLAHFIEADMVHPSPNLTSLNNTVDIIYISKVFHQWELGDAIRCTTLHYCFVKTR